MPSSPSPSRHATSIPSTSRRAGILLVATLLAVHSFLVLLWVMPSNPVRDAVGNDRVSAYINNDYMSFEQSWSIFAPVPRRAGDNVKVRAMLRGADGRAGRTTAWYDITGDEDRRIMHLVNPSRIHAVTRRLGGSVIDTAAQLNPDQRTLIASDLRTEPRRELERRLVEANTLGPLGRRNIDRYLLNEEMLVRFSTMYATARWGKDVKAVELRIGRRSVPRFSIRDDVRFADVPFTYTRVGWRKSTPDERGAQAAFDAYVESAAESKTTGGK